MDISESQTSVVPEGSKGIKPPYFDFINPKVTIDTDVKEDETYQEYVDRMVGTVPTVWQKNMIIYYALTTPILMLYAQGVRDPGSVEALGIFDTSALEQDRGKFEMLNTSSTYEEIRVALDSRSIKLLPDYRNRLLSQGLLCINGFSELKREIGREEKAKFEQQESAKKMKLSNILLGSYGMEAADHAEYKYLELQRIINGQITHYLTEFKDAHSRFTESEIINYGDLFNNASGELQNVTYQMGIPMNVMENIQYLSRTLLSS